MDINGAKILVTGGAGLIGSSTIDLLLRKYLNLLPPTLETVVLRIGRRSRSWLIDRGLIPAR